MWHAKDIETVFTELGSGEKGLTGEEAVKRLEQYGTNELAKEEKASPLILFLNQFKNVLIIILLIATGLSVLVGEMVDAAIIAVIVFFSAALGFIQEHRAEKALEALKKMLSATVTVLRDGREEELDTKHLVPGDVMLLEAGDRVPADARVAFSSSMRCDEAPLTGESLPVGKTHGTLAADISMGDRKNMVYTGSVVTYGKGTAVVTGTGMETEFGKIAKEVAAVKTEKTPLERRTGEIGKWLGLISLFVCLLVIGVSVVRELMNDSFNLESGLTMLMFGVALAVAAVPEALVETLGCTTVICTDKTGTLTRGEMTVRKIFTGGRFVEITGAGYKPTGEFIGKEGLETPLETLLRCGVLCNDAGLLHVEDRWAIKGDPTEAALVVAAVKAGMDHGELRRTSKRIAEVPFSSERKLMTTVHPAGDRGIAFLKGAPEVVLGLANRVMEGSGERLITDEDRARIRKANEDMANDALRVLALAYREQDEGESAEELEKDVVFLGLVGMMDPPRPEAVDAVRVCKEVHMTGTTSSRPWQ
jgi:Ca2+-transporting ATPase